MDKAEFFDRLACIFFPPRCLFCDEVVEYDDFWCGKCANPPYIRLGKVQGESLYNLAGALAAAEYSGKVRELIWRIKDKNDKRVFRFFAKEMHSVIAGYWSGISFDAIVPVPATASTIKERGFNQAEMLARHLIHYIDVTIYDDALLRLETTRVQHNLDAAQRRVNAAKSYAIGDAQNVSGKTVLLVDDVLTTGSTAAVCSGRLMDAGAKAVYVVTAAGAELTGSAR